MPAGRFGAGRRVAVIGDSHGRDMANGLHQVLPGDAYDVRYVYSIATCIRPVQGSQGQGPCPSLWGRIRTSPLVANADIIVLSFRWWGGGAKQLPAMLEELKRVSKVPDVRFVVTGRVVEPHGFHSSALWQAKAGAYRGNIAFPKPASLSPVVAIDKILQESAGKSGDATVFWSKAASQCPDRRCRFIDEDMNLLMWDVQHFTLIGARRVAEDLMRAFPSLFPLAGPRQQSTPSAPAS